MPVGSSGRKNKKVHYYPSNKSSTSEIYKKLYTESESVPSSIAAPTIIGRSLWLDRFN
ncbi:MAG: hypothetical protein HC942_29465 [Microcoleus sp. SU_5_6]|nr:hypothetical protein [Microcoleus sp. SU_5_6]